MWTALWQNPSSLLEEERSKAKLCYVCRLGHRTNSFKRKMDSVFRCLEPVTGREMDENRNRRAFTNLLNAKNDWFRVYKVRHLMMAMALSVVLIGPGTSGLLRTVGSLARSLPQESTDRCLR
jgi:hypothetical protein